jgi:hypothetical protein
VAWCHVAAAAWHWSVTMERWIITEATSPSPDHELDPQIGAQSGAPGAAASTGPTWK